jgi:hypothetical protein
MVGGSPVTITSMPASASTAARDTEIAFTDAARSQNRQIYAAKFYL